MSRIIGVCYMIGVCVLIDIIYITDIIQMIGASDITDCVDCSD